MPRKRNEWPAPAAKEAYLEELRDQHSIVAVGMSTQQHNDAGAMTKSPDERKRTTGRPNCGIPEIS